MPAYGSARTYQKTNQRRLIDAGGRELPGHLDDSARGARRAVVVVHDFVGLTDRTKAVTAHLADRGFLTFAPDLYRGRVARSREEAAGLARTLAWNRVAIELGLAIGALADQVKGGPVGILGFAMGGAAALVAAASVAKLSAAVTFYGIPQDVTLENPDLAIQGHFAARDTKCSPARVDELDLALRHRQIPHEFHTYATDNGFCDPSRPEVYSADGAALAWERTMAFLELRLG
jgi:carboxymethylenebutenolidase